MPALQRGAAWAAERLLGALRQSVPQNGRVHLHIIEKAIQKYFLMPVSVEGGGGFWPFLRRSVRVAAIKAVRGTIAIKAIFGN